MSGNAYQCVECHRVDTAPSVETMGTGQWITLTPVSRVLVCGPTLTIREDAVFCSPNCVVNAMRRVEPETKQ